MTYKAGDHLRISDSKTVRLNKDTAEIANAVMADIDKRIEERMWRHEHNPPGTYSLPMGGTVREAPSFLAAALGEI